MVGTTCHCIHSDLSLICPFRLFVVIRGVTTSWSRDCLREVTCARIGSLCCGLVSGPAVVLSHALFIASVNS